MAYDAFVCDGTEVAIKNPRTSGAFTLIPGVQTAGFSGSSKPTIEYTALSDTAAKFKTGRMDYGSFNFTIAYDPADAIHTALFTAAQTAGVEDDFQITLTDTGDATWAFKGAVQSFDLSLEKQQVGLASITVKVSGEITVTP